MSSIFTSARPAAFRLFAQSLVASIVFGSSANAQALPFEADFQSPPLDGRPGCYWYWINDNISKDGITKDLEAMARVGIGEAFVGNINEAGSRGHVPVLSDAWLDAMTHAVREGQRVGVKVGTFNCPGWSQSGGPWIGANQTMRYLTSSQMRVTGPEPIEVALPAPKDRFQDVVVLAYRVPGNDHDTIAKRKPTITCSLPTTRPANWADDDRKTSDVIPAQPQGNPAVVVDLATDEPFTARSLSLVPGPKRFWMRCVLQYEKDDGTFATIRDVEANRNTDRVNVGPLPFGPYVMSFPAVTSKHFRLQFSGLQVGDPIGAIDLAEIELSGAARLDAVVEKQLGKMSPAPIPAWDTYVWPTQAEPDSPALAVDPQSIVNLSKDLRADGTLAWNVPEGDWIIERIGMTPTGIQNTPATPQGTGYEIDKMNRAYLENHYDAYVGKIYSQLPAETRASAGHIIADSYETGSQNWTDGFDDVFRKAYGYDPLPWLPVLSGRLVGSASQSERFLWDLRRLVADRIASEYVGGMRDVLEKKGLRLWLENYGHWGFPAEFMTYGSQANELGGEFWMHGPGPSKAGSSVELRAAASCVHGYGKGPVYAEAFTSGSAPFQRSPWDLKVRGDWAMTEGVNQFILHVYIHQPYDDKAPGVNAWFNTEFNRKNTWFEQSRAFIDYLRRAQVLLKQGQYVADVAYFIGEDAPKMTGNQQPALPTGYGFDFIDAALLQQATIRDGAIVLPSGMSYRLLVLPPIATMRPAVLEKIQTLVNDGAAILGAKPTQSPSLQDYPRADERVRQFADTLWQNCDGKTVRHVVSRKGHVFNGAGVQEALDTLKIAADVTGTDETLLWIHRSTPEAEIYFLSNQTNDVRHVTPSFRVAAGKPMWWDAVNATRRDLRRFTREGGRTAVPIVLQPRESGFVIFDKTVNAEVTATGENFPEPSRVGTIDGPWTVSFDPSRGAPAQTTFEQLIDWTMHADLGIRHYSGTATYSRPFDAPAGTTHLELGPINGMASVRVNGQDVGTVWCAPWRVDISKALKPTGNQLEIAVTNNWVNQLLDDATRPEADRKTWTTLAVRLKDVKPQPSGLRGPVVLLKASE